MTDRLNSPPVWAGIAIRLADGTLHAIELTGSSLEASITVHEDEPDYTLFTDRFISPRLPEFEINIKGRGGYWSRFKTEDAPMAPEAIEATAKAIDR